MIGEKYLLLVFISCLLFPIRWVKTTRIPFIQNATIHTGYFDRQIPLINGTCHECLCMSPFSYSAVNCYPNDTCQLFSNFPVSYRIKPTPAGRLYFTQLSFPNTSQCCMPNITYLLNKLQIATMIIKSVPGPRHVVIDDYSYFVTVEMASNNLDRFDPNNLTKINSVPLPNSNQFTVAYSNGAYYIASAISSITVIDSENLTLLTTVSTIVSAARDIMLLNDGQTMVLSDVSNNRLVFLNRTSLVPIKYNVSFSLTTNFTYPHGLWRVNDSFFYVTSYYPELLYSFRATSTYNQWIQTLVLPSMNTASGGAANIMIDECGRFWSTSETNTIFIHDQQGQYIANWTIPNSAIFDIKIVDNYLIYLTDYSNSQVLHIDPGFQCYF